MNVARAARQLAEVTREFPGVAYLSLAGGDTEEFYIPHSGGPGDFSTAMKQKYRDRFGGEPPRDPQWADGASGSRYHSVQLQALREYFQEVRDAVKTGNPNLPFWYYIADFMRYQGNALAIQGNVYELSQISDGIYHTDGQQSFTGRQMKLAPQDLLATTFPKKETGIEFDACDLRTDGLPDSESHCGGFAMDRELFYQVTSEFFRRGGSIVHFAMNPNVVELRDEIARLHSEWTRNPAASSQIYNRATKGRHKFQIAPGCFSDGDFPGFWRNHGGSFNEWINVELENNYPSF